MEAVVDAGVPGVEADAGHGTVGEEFGVGGILLDAVGGLDRGTRLKSLGFYVRFAIQHFGALIVSILEVPTEVVSKVPGGPLYPALLVPFLLQYVRSRRHFQVLMCLLYESIIC